MTTIPCNRFVRLGGRLGALALALLALPADPVDAQVPTGVPVFSDPLEITNRYLPFEPGGLKIYAGREHGRRIGLAGTVGCKRVRRDDRHPQDQDCEAGSATLLGVNLRLHSQCCPR